MGGCCKFFMVINKKAPVRESVKAQLASETSYNAAPQAIISMPGKYMARGLNITCCYGFLVTQGGHSSFQDKSMNIT